MKRANQVNIVYVCGFRWIMLLSSGLALLSAFTAWVLIEGRYRAAQDGG